MNVLIKVWLCWKKPTSLQTYLHTLYKSHNLLLENAHPGHTKHPFHGQAFPITSQNQDWTAVWDFSPPISNKWRSYISQSLTTQILSALHSYSMHYPGSGCLHGSGLASLPSPQRLGMKISTSLFPKRSSSQQQTAHSSRSYPNTSSTLPWQCTSILNICAYHTALFFQLDCSNSLEPLKWCKIDAEFITFQNLEHL